ncbi:MAG: rhomboid family intramembrane serine protease [Luteolibacter sp.]
MFALILIGVHGWIECTGGVVKHWPLYVELGLQLPAVLHGWIWQLLSYGFLHGSWSHVLLNAGCLLLVGPRLEKIWGAWRVLGTALIGVIAGGLGHLLLGVTEHALLVGFSGGCMALVLLFCTISPDARWGPLGISAKNLGRGILSSELGLALIEPAKGWPVFSEIGRLLMPWGASVFQMGHACHFGGAFAGWLIGKWLVRRAGSC